ncbi:hypothetical protein KKA27_00205 [Patescibacteria group bacterium]|nr:hypothetical protein [Patescibacteria group bacterium]
MRKIAVRKYFAIILIASFLFSVCPIGCVVDRTGRARQQSLVIELSVECDRGITNACERLPEEEKKLAEMLK